MKTRPLPELLQLVIDNISFIKDHGICRCIEFLVDHHFINEKEFNLIAELIDRHTDYYNPYLFLPGEQAPRIEWLKQQIELLTKTENEKN